MRSRMTAASTLLLLAGCAAVPKDAGFGEVEQQVQTRIGQRVRWYQGTAEDAELRRAIDEILAKALTPQSAVQVALLNNRELQATYEELGIAQADLVEAGLLQNPVFVGEFRWPGQPANPWETDVVQNFLDVFVLPLRKRVAEAEFERVKFQVASAVMEHAARVRSAFYSLQGAEQLHEMRATGAQATEASAELASRQFEAGNISELDRSNHQGLHEQATIDLSLSEAEGLAQRERLNGLMGLWGQDADGWQTSGRLPGLPEIELSPEGLESLALSQRLDLSQARQEIEVVAQSLGLARLRRATGGVVQTELGGHYEREPEGFATWGPSLEVTLPIFNQGQPALARAGSLLRQRQERYAALAARVRSEVRAARDRMFAARKLAVRYQTVMLPLRERIVRESQLHYNAMQIGPLQLLQAKAAELDAGRQYIETLQNYWIARADLERAVGGELKAPATATQPAVLGPPSPAQDHQH